MERSKKNKVIEATPGQEPKVLRWFNIKAYPESKASGRREIYTPEGTKQELMELVYSLLGRDLSKTRAFHHLWREMCF